MKIEPIVADAKKNPDWAGLIKIQEVMPLFVNLKTDNLITTSKSTKLFKRKSFNTRLEQLIFTGFDGPRRGPLDDSF